MLISCLSTGKGTWGHVNRLIEEGNFGKTILITNEFGKENFSNKEAELIIVNTSQGLNEMRDEILSKLKGNVEGEVAVNFVSGTGKEHMALISALLKLGVGIRLVALTKDGVQEV
tara:strand:+ start:393 stop:737 length:345 start_codon:yes stop_codon:yes gene_type:complete